MKSDNYVDAISKSGFFPIKIEGRIDKASFQGNVFAGELEAFFTAAKALNSRAIFLVANTLSDDDFKHTSDFSDTFDNDEAEYEEGTDSKDLYEIDLIVALPSIADFKTHLNQEHSFMLTAKGGFAELSYFAHEDWWSAFLKEKELAISKATDNFEAIHKEMQKQQEKKDAELEKTVKGLINDQEFVFIPTQRGMIAYALEKHPELEEMDGEYLKILIQNLSDKIKAKRLNKRR